MSSFVKRAKTGQNRPREPFHHDIMNEPFDYKLDLTNQQFESLIEWLRSIGLEVQTEFEPPMVKPEDVQVCPMSDPDSTIMYSALLSS